MDSLSHDRGQALAIAVLVLGFAAAALAGLLAAQERLLLNARATRDGEGLAAAAGAAIADAHFAFVRDLRDPTDGARDPTAAEEAVFLASTGPRERALAAARELAIAQGRGEPRSVELRDLGATIEVSLVIDDRRHRVTIEKTRCCQR